MTRTNPQAVERIREPASGPPIVVAQQPVVLFQQAGSVHFAREYQRGGRYGAQPQAAMGPLPCGDAANRKPSLEQIRAFHTDIAAIIGQVANRPLNESVSVAPIHREVPGNRVHAPARIHPDSHLPEVASQSRLAAEIVIVGGHGNRNRWRKA